MDENNIEKCNNCEDTSKYFRYLLPDELEFLNSKKTQVAYLKGETIFKQGAFSPYVLYVLDGLVRVYLSPGGTKQLNLRLAGKGEFMAFSSTFGSEVYNYSAVAVKDSTICMIDKIALKELLLKNPEFAMRITSRNYRNENRYLEIVSNISYKQMRGKLASALLYLASDEFMKENVFHYLTRQEIADFASVTMESAIKFIKEFEKEGILKLNGKIINTLNKDALLKISKTG